MNEGRYCLRLHFFLVPELVLVPGVPSWKVLEQMSMTVKYYYVFAVVEWPGLVVWQAEG